jgi:hypothetical protein
VGRRLGDDFLMKTWENISIHQFWIVFSVFLILRLSPSRLAHHMPTDCQHLSRRGQHMGTMESMETDGDALETACCEESVLRLLSLAALANQEEHVAEVGTCWNHLEVSLYG